MFYVELFDRCEDITQCQIVSNPMDSKPTVHLYELTLHDNVTRLELLRLMSDGVSIREACRIHNVPLGTLFRLLQGDPLYRSQWDAARKDAADVLADDVLHALDNAETVADAMIGKARSDNLKTVAAWRNPQKYSQKLNVEVTHTIDLSLALGQADERARQALGQTGPLLPDKPSIPTNPHVDNSVDRRKTELLNIGNSIDSERAELLRRARKASYEATRVQDAEIVVETVKPLEKDGVD